MLSKENADCILAIELFSFLLIFNWIFFFIISIHYKEAASGKTSPHPYK